MTARPSPIADPQLITPADLGAALRVTPETVNRWCLSGAIPLNMLVRTPGGQFRIRAEYLRSLLAGAR